MQNTKQDIANVRPLTAFVAKLITVMVHLDKNENGKLETTEWLSAANFLLFEGIALGSDLDLKKIKGEIQDLDKKEVAELIAVFSLNHDLKDDELEMLIEDGLMLLAHMANYVERVGNWRRNRQEDGVKVVDMNRIAIADRLNKLTSQNFTSRTADR